jgi:hypothetical protein
MKRGRIFHWSDRIHAFDISKPRVEFQIRAIASPVLLTSMPSLQISALVTGWNDMCIPFSGIALGLWQKPRVSDRLFTLMLQVSDEARQGGRRALPQEFCLCSLHPALNAP